jgi:ribonuclease HI
MSDGAGVSNSASQSTNPDDEEATLNALAEAIQQLTPSQRRRLLRRLRTSGLLESDEELTDRDRLRVAPALGMQARRRIRRSSQRSRPAGPNLIPANPPREAAERETPPIVAKSEPYRSAVSGKVVKGVPVNEAPLEPHGMAPLPGQAPEQAIVVIFDGGSRGNPGQGYGSYALRWPGQAQQIVQLRFGDRVTNNEAEYDTLIAALEAILQRLADSGAAPKSAKVEIRGDSLLVVNQVKGLWEAKEARLQVRRDHVRELLDAFGAWQLIHHDRENSVQTLGH